MIAGLLAAAVALAAGLVVLRTHHRASDFRQWRAIGLAALVWGAVSAGAMVGVWLGFSDRTRLLIHDTGGVLFAGLALISIRRLLANRATLDRDNERVAWIDALMVAVVAIAAASEFLIEPLLASTIPARDVAWEAAFAQQAAMIGLLVLTSLALVLSQRTRAEWIVAMLLAAFSLPPIGVALRFAGFDRGLGAATDEVAWAVSFVVLAIAATVSARPATPHAVELLAHRETKRWLGIAGTCVLLITVMTVHATMRSHGDLVLIGSVIALGVLLALRLSSISAVSERLDARTRERDRLMAVVDMSSAIIAEHDVDSLLGRLADAAARAVGSDRAEVTLFDAEGRIDRWVPLGLSPEETSRLAHAQFERVPDGTTGPFMLEPSTARLAARVVTAWHSVGKLEALVIPLQAAGLSGQVQLWSPNRRGAFGSEDTAAAAAIVQEGALALVNARLLAEARRRADERNMLVEIVRAATSSLDMRTVLQRVATASLDIAGTESSTFLLVDREAGTLTVIADATIPEWPGTDEIGTTYRIGEWSFDEEALARRTPMHVEADDPWLTQSDRANLRELGIASMVSTALYLGDTCLGVMLLLSRHARAFGPEADSLAMEIASQAVVAIHNARLLEHAQRRAEERAALLRVSQAATSSLELRTVLREVAQAALGTADAECCSVELWHREQGIFEVVADESTNDWSEPGIEGARFPEDDTQAYLYARTSREPLVQRRDDPDLPDERVALMDEWGARGLVIYPIWADDTCFGLMQLLSRSATAFDEDAIRLGKEMAAQAALAIQNARLLAESRRQADEQSALLRVSRAMSAGVGLREVAREAARASVGIGGAESCEIEVYHPETLELEIVGQTYVDDWVRQKNNIGKRYSVLDWPLCQRLIIEGKPYAFDRNTPGLTPHEWKTLFDEDGTESAIAFPLTVDGVTIGLYSVYSRKLNAFDEHSIRIGCDLAGQLAMAIDRVRLLDEARRRADEQTGMLALSRAVSASVRLDEVLDLVSQAGVDVIGAEACQIELWHPNEAELELAAERHAPTWEASPNLGRRFPVSDWPVTAQVLDSREPLLFDDQSWFLSEAERETMFLSDGTKSALAVPLVIDGESAGVLSFYSRERQAFDQWSLRRGLDLGNQAALAIGRARLHQALEERAHTDGLTRLLNHRALLDRMDQEMERSARGGQPLSILMIDLDRFKSINDFHGHLVGDEVLRRTAQVLRSAVRAMDHVGRYGGDEFMVVLPEADVVEAVGIAERLQAGIGTIVMPELEGGPPLSLSIGWASFPLDGETRSALIDAADRAMYRAKERLSHEALVHTT